MHQSQIKGGGVASGVACDAALAIVPFVHQRAAQKFVRVGDSATKSFVKKPRFDTRAF
jgi:hypothetical protein